ncbi:hypothetical protein ACQVP2_08645 [Methylobacterium aquaticum]|uniref:hypothetical protein n=1 Tax=Methylobacterium aquaticum TaxID=270351 RepID=UPI003D16B37C
MDNKDLASSEHRYVDHKPMQEFLFATYIAVRPTIEISGYGVRSRLDRAETFHLDYGWAEGPPFSRAMYDEAEDAIEALVAIRAAQPHLRLWYDGEEIRSQISGDVWLGLAEILTVAYECWEVVAKVADGTLAPDDPQVLNAIAEVPLIATAVANITP